MQHVLSRTTTTMVTALSLGCGVIGPATGPLTGGGTDGFSDAIIENTEYQNAPSICSDAPLNDVTSTFVDAINSKYQGQRYHDGSVDCLTGGENCPLPSFVVDDNIIFGSVDGSDGIHADAASLFVFAGHGGISPTVGPHVGFTTFDEGNPETAGTCRPRFDNHIRLGRDAGGKARIAIWAASCIGAGYWENQNPAFWDTLGQSNTLQHLAFLDSPDIGDDELHDFAEHVKNGDSNLSAWADELSFNNPNESWNQPVVFTLKGTDDTYDDFIDRYESGSFWTLQHFPEPPLEFDEYVVDDYEYLGLGANPDPEPSTCQF